MASGGALSLPPDPARKNRRATLERIEKFISPIYFSDVNLHHHLYPSSINEPPLDVRVSHYPAPGRIRFEDLPPISDDEDDELADDATSASLWQTVDSIEGRAFGPTWSTHWFRVRFDVPNRWIGRCCVFRFDAGCEAMIWRREKDGESAVPVLGLSEKKTEWTISASLTSDDVGEKEFFVEMACNTLFGAGKDGFINPPDEARSFAVRKCRPAVKDLDAYRVFLDLTLLLETVNALGENEERGYDALYAGNDVINAISRLGFKKTGYDEAKKIASRFFASSSAPSPSSLHRIHAVGNCHIDTAWLWPYEETERKAGRSFASAVHLMSSFPKYKFVASQAVQFQWVKERYPDVFRKMKQFSAKGRFLPVGGAWVEMDGNLPSGESFCRQFIYGQRFFEAEFGIRCKEFWLPDTFGYSAQLPQIMRAAEMERFVTQKLSWSLINKFPHNSFTWEGIDGSRVLTHFPPGDSYEMSVTVDELLRTVKNNKDKGRVKDSLFLYGHGDGGGGPTEEMLHRLDSLSAVPGLPFAATTSTPDEFFFALEKSSITPTSSASLCTWVGELYLELHQGTFTSQASTKRENRRLENLLRTTEFLATLAFFQRKPRSNVAALNGTLSGEFPRAEIESAWKNVLLNQFHDVLPGTSIGCVYDDVHRLYKESDDICNEIIRRSLESIIGQSQDTAEREELPGTTSFLVNPTSFRRREVICVDSGLELTLPQTTSMTLNGNGEVGARDGSPKRPRKKTRFSVADVAPQQIIIDESTGGSQKRHSRLVLVEVEAFSFTELVQPVKDFEPVVLRDYQNETNLKGEEDTERDGYLLQNGLISAHLTPDGRLRWIRVLGDEQKRNALCEGHLGNEFVIYDDIPLYWDAWDVMDYHLETEKVVERREIGDDRSTGAAETTGVVVSRGPLRAEVRFSFAISAASSVVQSVILDAECPYLRFDTRVSWHENRKMLKVQFPLNVRTDNATYEIQYGHVQRPTHQNTSWDAAKHEVVGHRWADLSEYGYGVALINDCKYGHSVTRRNVLNLSLLRSPKAPDAACDMNDNHRFSYALMPHVGSLQKAGVIGAAYALNAPLVVAKIPEVIGVDVSIATPFVRVSSPAVIVDCVTTSHFSTSAVLLRLYESFGSTVSTLVSINESYKVGAVKEVNLLETEVAEVKFGGVGANGNNSFQLHFTPFQMKTVIVTML